MMVMCNVTDKIPGEVWRCKAALLLNFCEAVIRPECDQLKVAMAEYAATLPVASERRAA